ncbi:MAG: HAMP domain-containing sensor histidine kinase [Candidatus Choladocola sp.]|nr:HAMP domain-containing sensor histidine kinase [Candidatus Choladocola sp.]
MGSVEKRRSSTLSGIFLRYVLVMIGSLLTLGICTVLIFNILVNTGCIYPANYAERKINEAYDMIQNADEVTEDIIPLLCHYVIFSADGGILRGNMPEDLVETARNVANHGTASGDSFYKVIPRTEECVVLQYSLTPQYQSAFLREHFIEPQTLMTIIIVLSAIAIILLPSVSFGKKMKRKMKPVMNAVEKIKNQELEYKVSYSGVKEIDDCLSSIDEMRYALKDSLERQWKTEQEKNRQMSALAHDIKTPLTVIRGNAELLSEMEMPEEQAKYIDYITGSALQIQNYVQTLIEVTKSADGYQYRFENIKTEDILGDIRKQTFGLAEVFGLIINWEEQYTSETVSIVYDQVVRAVMNIIKNAAEHTPKGETINVYVEEQRGKLTFTVEDTGSGFTKEALLHGTEQFFMDDVSRSSGVHYGIGLFSAKSIAGNHGGKISLANSEKTGGAKVEILIDSCDRGITSQKDKYGFTKMPDAKTESGLTFQ